MDVEREAQGMGLRDIKETCPDHSAAPTPSTVQDNCIPSLLASSWHRAALSYLGKSLAAWIGPIYRVSLDKH
jgi:hypothetical protein